VGPRAGLEAAEMRKIRFPCPATKSLPLCEQPLVIPTELIPAPKFFRELLRNGMKINQKTVFTHHL
jgi:hypothetical protein